MQGYIVFGALILLVALVLVRVRLLKRMGVDAFHFGEKDKKDFLIPPFVLLYLYLLIASVWNLPTFAHPVFESTELAWVGVASCACGVALFAWALVSFGTSFRVGLDEDHPGELVTSGAFAVSRNPIYVAFFLVLLGIFLVFPTWAFLVYLIAATWLFNRQVLLEEASLKKIYGTEYERYCSKVRRYL